MNLKGLTDSELLALSIDVKVEQERRKSLADIPEQIADLTARYIAGGGDPDTLHD